MDNSFKNINNIFRKYSVAFAYLFGSTAKGKIHSRSDIDIAVYFHNNVQHSQYLERLISLLTDIKILLKKEVDIVILNNRCDEIVMSVLCYGVIIFDDEPTLRKTYQHKFSMKYFDFSPYRNRYLESVINRLKRRKENDERAKRYQESIQKIR